MGPASFVAFYPVAAAAMNESTARWATSGRLFEVFASTTDTAARKRKVMPLMVFGQLSHSHEMELEIGAASGYINSSRNNKRPRVGSPLWLH